MRDLLPEYAAGALSETRRAEVAEHLARCAGCRAELAAWEAMANLAVEPPGPEIVRRALLRGSRPDLATARPPAAEAGAGAGAGARWSLPLALPRAQIRLVPG